ncbi:hypothetical protein IFR05_014003 [Cadophora sp. M221]|nr:hypothetical protein IFR05_014003 [Cadophora sp. M221]
MRSLAIFITALLGAASAVATANESKDTLISQAVNITQKHTNSTSADIVFGNSSESHGTALVLHESQLQLDDYRFSLSAWEGNWDRGGTRWLPTKLFAGDGTVGFIDSGSSGIVILADFFNGWLVCKWSHGFNVPRLFHMLKAEDAGVGFGPNDIPSSCARALLMPKYI